MKTKEKDDKAKLAKAKKLIEDQRKAYKSHLVVTIEITTKMI